MTASTRTASTATITEVDVVRAVFGAFASGDLAALSDLLHADATWHHHNDDRFGGIHRGADAVVAYLTESALLTGGTLHALSSSSSATRRPWPHSGPDPVPGTEKQDHER